MDYIHNFGGIMIYRGFKFGMILQLAVGPMCLMVFNTSTTYGFLIGLSLVLAISLIDGLYIILSGLGIAAIINKEKIKTTIKILGCIVLVLFGTNTITGAFGFKLLPDLKLFSNTTNQNIFIQGLLLTSSNPLTIIFWGGVFSTQVAEYDFSKKQLVFFGFGCILSTLFFLTIVSFCGSILSGFLPQVIIKILNVMVGAILIYFGIKLLLKK
jgi:threonine/homoserine/homoserine lactone efflux protein